MTELKQTIDTVKSSAPDLDQIDYAIVKCLPLEYLTILLDIYNRLFDEGTFPHQRRLDARYGDPHPQAGKPWIQAYLAAFVSFQNYGKDSFTGEYGWYVKSRTLVPNNQLEFRPISSCTDSLVALTNCKEAS